MNIPKNKNETSFETVHTDHYTFTVEKKLRININDIPISWHYRIGAKDAPCLSMFFYVKEAGEKYNKAGYKTAQLSNIEVLDSCIENEISEEILEKYSFAKELLEWIFKHLRKQFPYIQHIELTDMSYIPCNRKILDKVDLLTYSIAHDGKTWYESNYNAYLVPKEKMEEYRNQIVNYMSEDFKAKYDWNTFLNYHVGMTTDYAFTKIRDNYYEWEDLFNKAKTFPDFFLEMRKRIPRKEKCMFYRDWLQKFIYSCIRIERVWIIDIPKQKGGRGRVRTRKAILV
jgi:hypothetical protein